MATECRNADWELIGFEDGGEGRLPSYVSNHRKACAKYDIVPNLDAYIKGHTNGTRQYCTEPNGFLAGKKGRSYNGVCPPDLEEAFLSGYTIGRRFYAVSSDIDKLKRSVRTAKRKVDDLKGEVKDCEDALIAADQSEGDRRRLLNEIKENQREIGRLERKITEKEREISLKQREYHQLTIEYDRY